MKKYYFKFAYLKYFIYLCNKIKNIININNNHYG